MNVLYLLNHAGKAGTERYVQTLIERLDGKSINAFFAYNEEGLLVQRVKELGVETYRIEMNSRFDIIAAYKLAKLCKKLDIDLIHTHYLRENYTALLSRIFNPKVKVMYTSHFILKNDAFTRFTNRIMVRLEAGIIAVCNKGREVLISNGMTPSKVKVLFNAVDPEFWKKTEESTLRKEFNISDDTFVLLCASRFAHDKGHKYLVESIARLKEKANRKFVLVLAGDGPLLEQTKKQVKELGLEDVIIFTGFRSDIKNLYNGSDLYINSSEHEALSFLIIEALASGLPVIATDMGGNNDIINDSTACGILVKYEDPEDTSAAINRVMDDRELYGTLKQNAFTTIEDKFNLVKMANETYNLYKEFTGK